MTNRPDDLHTIEVALLDSLASISDRDIGVTDVHDIDPMNAATWLEAQITSRCVSTTPRRGAPSAGSGTTRSARPGMRAMPSLRRLYGSTTPPCSTTDRAGSTSLDR